MNTSSGNRTGHGAPAYLPFVDGLRAVSILAVVLYHCGVPGVPGGYVGVDVFFVISGFLIIGQIVGGLRHGTFALSDFWARRAWRILPPFGLVLVFCLAAAPIVILLPDDLNAFAYQAASGATMTINHLFLEQQGYFDTAADTKVLLHFWSLAVEEQFYLVAPLLIGGIWAASRRAPIGSGPPGRNIGIAAVLIFLASLAGSIYWSTGPDGRNYGFYLTALRSWEFVAGGAIGAMVPLAARMPDASKSALAAVGLSLIVFAAVTFEAGDVYPGWRALLPVGGATAIIASGMAGGRGPVILALSTRPMVAIGLVSYAWYLWHWPLLAFARIRNFGELDVWPAVGLCAVALGLAALSYLLVERPVRMLRQRGKVGLGWKPVLTGVAACVLLAIGGRQTMDALAHVRRLYLPADYAPVAAGSAPVCDLRTVAGGRDCVAAAAGRDTTLVLGDSMALLPRDAIAAAAAARGVFLLSAAAPACPAITGVDIFLYDPELQEKCAALHRRLPRLLGEMGDDAPRSAILFSAWPSYAASGNGIALGEAGSGIASADQDATFRDGLRNTVVQLRSWGIERVLLIGSVPFFARAAPNCLALADDGGADRTRMCGIRRDEADQQKRRAEGLIRDAVGGLDEVRVISTTDRFCDAEWCRPWRERNILFVDKAHLADVGMTLITAAHAGDFDWLFGRPGL